MKAFVRPLLSCAVLLAAFSASQARADFVTYGTPSPAYTGSTILLTSPAADFTNITSLTGPFMTVTFSDPVNVRTVPSGGWASTPKHTAKSAIADSTCLICIISLLRGWLDYLHHSIRPGPKSAGGTVNLGKHSK